VTFDKLKEPFSKYVNTKLLSRNKEF
jgi:hypothetical protein